MTHEQWLKDFHTDYSSSIRYYEGNLHKIINTKSYYKTVILHFDENEVGITLWHYYMIIAMS